MKAIIFFIGILIIGFLFLVHNAMSKPVYNKMSNVWEDDPQGRQYSHITIMAMLFIAFFLGSMF
jgi:hypothetical protein